MLRIAILCWLALSCRAMACTGLLIQGSAVSGRTVEFGVDLDMSVAVIPRNMNFVGQTPGGKNGLAYNSKYAAAGIYCFQDKVLMDGINEKGLVAAAFYFPGYAEYARIGEENLSRAVSPVEFPHWILTQFATLQEVRDALQSVVIAPTVLADWGAKPPPMHYIVYDSSGQSLVIEPIGGELVVHENPIGVITNSPTFDWHMVNLNNYINLSPYNIDPVQMNGMELAPFGQGSGMVGLPGDFTPPSRFVRAAIFSTTALSSNDPVNQAFHLLNQFDIPLGSVRQKKRRKTSYDSTLLTSVKEPKAMRYYYKSYDDQTVRYVDLHQFDLQAREIQSLRITGRGKSADVSSLLR